MKLTEKQQAEALEAFKALMGLMWRVAEKESGPLRPASANVMAIEACAHAEDVDFDDIFNYSLGEFMCEPIFDEVYTELSKWIRDQIDEEEWS